MPSTKSTTAFTLLSVIIALAITLITAIIAVQGWTIQIDRRHAEAAGRIITDLLLEARHRTLISGTVTSVCVTDGYTKNCVAGYGKYLTLFDGDASDRALLHRLRPVRSADIGGISAQLLVLGGFGKGILQFNPDGKARLAGSIYYCSERSSRKLSHRTVLSPSGNIRTVSAGADPKTVGRSGCGGDR